MNVKNLMHFVNLVLLTTLLAACNDTQAIARLPETSPSPIASATFTLTPPQDGLRTVDIQLSPE